MPDNQILDSNFNPVSPYGTVGLSFHRFASLPPQDLGIGSDILISPNITFTAAHILVNNGEDAELSFSYIGAVPNGSGGNNGSGAVNPFNGTFTSSDSKYSDGYVSNGYKNDYGVLRSVMPFGFPFYSDFRRENNYPRTVNVVGYPKGLIGMHKGTATATIDGPTVCGNGLGVIHYPINTSIGMSGGPIFNADNTFTTGIHNFHCTSSTGAKYGNGIPFNEQNLTEILTWLWSPTGTMDIQYPVPNIDINLVAIQNFDANFSPFNLMDIHGDIEERNGNSDANIRWESSINGVIGNGGVVSSDILKLKLTSGNHRITAIIDSNGESGEKNININIIRPVGQFTSPNQCIKNIANPITCDFDLSWTVTDTPETSVVLNTNTGNNFATGNSGTRSVTATNTNINFKLYPSNQKKILLDGLDTNSLVRKTPIGALIRDLSICSLKPSPVDPVNFVIRDAKATPPGCGADLSWSNIKWASPSIYYKKTGMSNWTHLYKIPCVLDGTVCTGSINTNEILPELVPVNGIQFKLLQFNDVTSGQLSAPFSVSAHRYADSYEYDDGDVTDFNGMGVGFPSNMVIDNRLTTGAILGVAQHNHSFHSPAVYDSKEDIDSVQIPTADFVSGKTLSVTVFNMSTGLNVDMQLKCAGIVIGGIFDGQTGIFDFNSNPSDPIITDPVTGAKTMTFRITKQTSQIGSQIDCLYNRVIIRRIAGTPSENLRYSVVINDPDNNNNNPVLDTASSLCNNNYCINLLGHNFGTNAVIDIRENINGSPLLKRVSGNDIYNRSPVNGSDRLFFPIRNLVIQDKFNNNGLCFKVLANSNGSNERCFTRPTTAAQGPFMGKSVQSYRLGSQDKEHTSYVVVGATGNKLKIWGNSWKNISYNYNVTANTILEFEFRSDQQQPEISAIGFISSGTTSVQASKTWQVYGAQNWGNQSHHNYLPASWKTYQIPIGQTFNGSVSDMVFIADEDVHVGQNVTFKNPMLFESSIAIDQYDDVPDQRAYDDDRAGDAVPLFSGASAQSHNFHDAGDQDWTIFAMLHGFGVDITTTALGTASARMVAYRVDGQFMETSPGRWDITASDLTQVGSDLSDGTNTVNIENITGSVQAYVIKSTSSGATGTGSDYQIVSLRNDPIVTLDQYDDIAIRGYNDDSPADGVPIAAGAIGQLHNFHDASDQDWTIFAMGSGSGVDISTVQLGVASARLSAYRIDGQFMETSPGRWDITLSDLTLIGSDQSDGNNSVTIQNTSGAIQGYVIKTTSSAVFGVNTDYRISSVLNNP